MPTMKQLPRSLEKLPELNAAQVRYDPDFDVDTDRLCRTLEKWVSPAFGESVPGIRYIRLAKQTAFPLHKIPGYQAPIHQVMGLEFALGSSPSVQRSCSIETFLTQWLMRRMYRLWIDGQKMEVLSLNNSEDYPATRIWMMNNARYEVTFSEGSSYSNTVSVKVDGFLLCDYWVDADRENATVKFADKEFTHSRKPNPPLTTLLGLDKYRN